MTINMHYVRYDLYMELVEELEKEADKLSAWAENTREGLQNIGSIRERINELRSKAANARSAVAKK